MPSPLTGGAAGSGPKAAPRPGVAPHPPTDAGIGPIHKGEGPSLGMQYLSELHMNFLGHLLVSGNAPLTIVGNFMADAVKGRDLSGWSAGLQTGIRMHRRIDSYTDNHPLTLRGRERLRAHSGKYAGVALDLFYDHVIASRWDELSAEPLPVFAQRMYRLLLDHALLMPERTQHMLPYMMENDWLSSYAEVAGIKRALKGLSARVPAGEALLGAERVLVEHHADFERECMLFLPQLQQHLTAPNG